MDLTTDCLEVLHHRLNSLALQFQHVEIETDSSGKSGTWVISEIDDVLNEVRAKVFQFASTPATAHAETAAVSTAETAALSTALAVIDSANAEGFSRASYGKPLSHALQVLYLKGLNGLQTLIPSSKLLILVALGGLGVWETWHAMHGLLKPVKPLPAGPPQPAFNADNQCAAIMDSFYGAVYLKTWIHESHVLGKSEQLKNVMEHTPPSERVDLKTLSTSSVQDFLQIADSVASMVPTIKSAYASVFYMRNPGAAEIITVNNFLSRMKTLADKRGILTTSAFYIEIVQCMSQTSSELLKEEGKSSSVDISVLDKYRIGKDAENVDRFSTNTEKFRMVLDFMPLEVVDLLLAHNTVAHAQLYKEWQQSTQPVQDVSVQTHVRMQQFSICASILWCKPIPRSEVLLQLSSSDRQEFVEGEFREREKIDLEHAADVARLTKGNNMLQAEAQRFIIHLDQVVHAIESSQATREMKGSMKAYAVQIFSWAYFSTRQTLVALTSKDNYIEDKDVQETADMYFHERNHDTWACNYHLDQLHFKAVHDYIGKLPMHDFYLVDLSLDTGVKELLTSWATALPTILMGGAKVDAVVNAVATGTAQAITKDKVKETVDKVRAFMHGGPVNSRWARDNFRPFCFEDFLESEDFIANGGPYYSDNIQGKQGRKLIKQS